jgi:mannosyltransferase OCH1-like enzyme
MENAKQIERLNSRSNHGLHIDTEKIIAMHSEMFANTVCRKPGRHIIHEMWSPAFKQRANAKTAWARADDDHGMVFGWGH